MPAAQVQGFLPALRGPHVLKQGGSVVHGPLFFTPDGHMAMVPGSPPVPVVDPPPMPPMPVVIGVMVSLEQPSKTQICAITSAAMKNGVTRLVIGTLSFRDGGILAVWVSAAYPEGSQVGQLFLG